MHGFKVSILEILHKALKPLNIAMSITYLRVFLLDFPLPVKFLYITLYIMVYLNEQTGNASMYMCTCTNK